VSAVNLAAAWACSCASDDFEGSYQRMVAANVRFISAPRDEPYGRLAVFLDLEGNRWDLLGPDPHTVPNTGRVDPGDERSAQR
jgi:hypothetical protein